MPRRARANMIRDLRRRRARGRQTQFRMRRRLPPEIIQLIRQYAGSGEYGARARRQSAWREYMGIRQRRSERQRANARRDRRRRGFRFNRMLRE